VKKVGLKKQNKNLNKSLLILILALVVFGIIAVTDASAPQALNAYGDKFFLSRQQFLWGIIGVIALFVSSNIKYTFWEKLAIPLFIISILFLIIVLIPQLGFSAMGARRWIVFGPVNFQPSEIVKFTLGIYFAKVASKNKKILSYLIPFVFVVALVMFQPDLGTTLIISIIAMSQIFVSDINLWYFFGTILGGLVAGIPLILLSDYRKERLLTFLQMAHDPLGSSYHIRQILIALGSGGFWGVGFGASRQKYLFLPEASTDSIFAVIAEELGFVGGMLLIGLFIYFILQGFIVAKNAPDTFSKVLAVGITSWIGGQALLNIGSMVAIIPLTGIPLPFISYGGSSLVMILVACGILLNISKYSILNSHENRRQS